MGLDTIIALDLGKFKTVACVMHEGTRRHRFETLDTTPQRLHDLFTTHASADPARTPWRGSSLPRCPTRWPA